MRLANLLAFGLPVVLIVAVAQVTGDRTATFLMIGIALAAVVLRQIALAVGRWDMSRQWHRAPTWNLPNDWTLDEDGVSITDGAFRTTISWGAFKLVREEDDRFVFFGGPTHSHILPIRSLDVRTNQIQHIRDLVAEVTTSGRLGRGVD